MSGFTKGPWEVFVEDGKIDRFPGIESENLSIIVYGTDEELRCGVQGDTPEESIANARLIAAAPELLESLQWVMDTLQGDSGTGHSYWEQFPEYHKALEALNKATKQP